MASRIVGIALDDQVLRGVEVWQKGRPGRRDRSVHKSGSVRLSPGVVDQGEVLDAEAFASHLRELWAEAGFSTKRVALGLDARSAVVRRADLPDLDDDELQQAAAFVIGDLLSYPLNEALVSSQEVGRVTTPAGVSIQALTLAIKQQTLVDIHAAVEGAGLRPSGAQLTQTALLAVVNDQQALADDAIGLIVVVSESNTNVIVHDNAGLLLSRVVTAGVGAQSSLSDELQAELDLLSGFADGSGAGQVPAAAGATGVATVMEGIRRTVNYYRTEVDDRPIVRVVLCGDHSAASGLAHALADSLPEAEVLRHERGQWPDSEASVSEFDEACSVAMAALMPAPKRTFDFVPTVYREQRADKVRLTVGAVAGLAVGLLLMSDAVDRRSAAEEQDVIATGVERQVDVLRVELTSFDGQRQLEQDALSQRSRVDELSLDVYPMSTVIRQLAEVAPADTFLLSARLQRTVAGDSPTAYDGPTPPAVLTLTGVAADLDGVGRWMQAAETVPLIDGLWLAQSAIGPYDSTDRVGAVFTVEAVLTELGFVPTNQEATE